MNATLMVSRLRKRRETMRERASERVASTDAASCRLCDNAKRRSNRQYSDERKRSWVRTDGVTPVGVSSDRSGAWVRTSLGHIRHNGSY